MAEDFCHSTGPEILNIALSYINAFLSHLSFFFFLSLYFLLKLKLPTSEKSNFGKLLLNRCQKEFEKVQDDEILEKKQKELQAIKDVRTRKVHVWMKCRTSCTRFTCTCHRRMWSVSA